MTGDFKTDKRELSRVLATDINFDVLRRDLIVAERNASLFFMDAFIKDDVFEKIFEFLYKIEPKELKHVKTMHEFSLIKMPYVEVGYSNDLETVVTAVLAGQTALLIDGINDVLLVDIRTYPVRSIDEPDKDRSLRGSRDGFVETLIFNTALVRRRIRDPKLRFEHLQVGTSSKVDVAIGYMDGKVDSKTVEKLRKKLKNINISGISMTSQALSELLVPSAFFNPFPKVRFTERPDFASACILEGKIVLIMDNSPAVMIFPNSIADFMKETDDYYFPPLTGTYVRIIRAFVSVLTVIMTPLVLIVMNEPRFLPEWLSFINTDDEYSISIFFQFLLLELVVDGLRLASLNTPNTLSSSLGIIGGLILGEFAVEADWFVPETIMYMAFVAIASFAQPSFEMGYAMKFSRIFLLILSELFAFWGFFGGLAAIILLAACSKTFSGRGYLSPVIPFSPRNFARMFVRTTIRNKQH
ncbi:MAG: spore germination protein [Clostridia bacterium]|nr:spore germination protein [Clostridia bacterium]